MENQKRLYRSNSDKMFLGVCAGLAKYFSLDPTLVRVGWAILTVLGVGSPILIYLLMAFIVPKES